MRKKLRSQPHSLSMMKEMQRQVAQTPNSRQHLRWTLRQQQFLQRQAPLQHRRL
jgi:hypothetical protein